MARSFQTHGHGRPRHFANSIRAVLLSRLLASTAAVLVLAGAAVFVVVRRSLAEQFDENLHDRLKGLASLLFQQGERLSFEFSDELMPEYAGGERASFFELSFEDGRSIERSDSLQGTSIGAPESGAAWPFMWSPRLPGDRAGRAIASVVEVRHVYPEEGPDRPQAARVMIVVARGVEDLIAAERMVLLSCLATAGTLLVLLSVSTWRAVSRALKPADRLASTLRKLDVDHLPEKIEFGPLPAELQPVARTTQELVRRLDEALQRERRTTANIAHELRTPISELVTVSEVALHEDEDQLAQREAIETIRTVAWRMGRMVSSLLKLARLESEDPPAIREQVDLPELVRAVHQGLTLSHNGSEPEVVLDLPPAGSLAAVVEVDPDALSIVVTNLLENALHYGSREQAVVVDLALNGNGARLRIRNHIEDLDPLDVKRFREPFWRKDRARSDQDHSGLGLALAQVVSEQSGWSIDFALEDGVVAATLSIPEA